VRARPDRFGAHMRKHDPTDQAPRRERAERIVRLAWIDLPAGARELLERVGASQWEITTETLGRRAGDLLRSAGHGCPRTELIVELDQAVGVWVAQLRVVLINCMHPALEGLDARAEEAVLARFAWRVHA
jgi:hypothetical protein